MDLRQIVDQYWLRILFGLELVLVVGAMYLWRSGLHGMAILLVVYASLPPIAFITALIDTAMN